jgi:hypothetical protein
MFFSITDDGKNSSTTKQKQMAGNMVEVGYIVAETSGMERKVVTLWVATTQRKRDIIIIIFFLFRAKRGRIQHTVCVLTVSVAAQPPQRIENKTKMNLTIHQFSPELVRTKYLTSTFGA